MIKFIKSTIKTDEEKLIVLDAEIVNDQDIDFNKVHDRQYPYIGIYGEYTTNYYIQIFYIKFGSIYGIEIIDDIINDSKSILREKKLLDILHNE